MARRSKFRLEKHWRAAGTGQTSYNAPGNYFVNHGKNEIFVEGRGGSGNAGFGGNPAGYNPPFSNPGNFNPPTVNPGNYNPPTVNQAYNPPTVNPGNPGTYNPPTVNQAYNPPTVNQNPPNFGAKPGEPWTQPGNFNAENGSTPFFNAENGSNLNPPNPPNAENGSLPFFNAENGSNLNPPNAENGSNQNAPNAEQGSFLFFNPYTPPQPGNPTNVLGVTFPGSNVGGTPAPFVSATKVSYYDYPGEATYPHTVPSGGYVTLKSN